MSNVLRIEVKIPCVIALNLYIINRKIGPCGLELISHLTNKHKINVWITYDINVIDFKSDKSMFI